MINAVKKESKFFSLTIKNIHLFRTLIVVGVLILTFLIMFLSGHKIYVNSEPYQYSLELIQKSYKVRLMMRQEFKVEWNVFGNIDEEKASISYNLKSDYKTAVVEVEAKKIPIGWEYQTIKVTTKEKNPFVVDLLTAE